MDQVLETIKRAHQAARDRLVQENMPLVWSIVAFFQPGEDCFIQHLVLLKAIDRFDTAYEVKFSTYAVPLIIGEIRRYLRDACRLVVLRLRGKFEGRSRLAEYGGAGAKPEELSEKTGIRKEEIVQSLAANTEWTLYTGRFQ